MPKQAIVPTHRFEFQITVLGFMHKLHMFVGLVPTVLADVTGFDTVARSGYASTGASNAIDGFWDALKFSYRAADATFGQVLIEARSGTNWLPAYSYGTAITPVASVLSLVASQATLMFRDTAYEKMPLDLMETGAVMGKHDVTYATTQTALASLVAHCSPQGGTVTNDFPEVWWLSRAGRYCASFQSATTTLNRKLRRKRFIV